MKLFLVNNGNGTLLGIFKKKKDAKKLVEVGAERWREFWVIEKVETEKIEDWVLAGNEAYRRTGVAR